MSNVSHQPNPSLESIGRVLLAEDDELVGLNLKLKLTRSHVECDWFETFETAVTALHANNYHAVIADMYLKSDRPNGLEIVKLANEKGIPSVIITSRLDMAIAKRGLNEGADALIEKPFEITELVKILQNIWENPRGLIGRRERFLDLQSLTDKEKEIARLVLKGLSNQEVADVSGNSLATIKFYTNQIFEKCSVHSRGELFNTIFPS